MSLLQTDRCFRASGGLKGWIGARLLALAPFFMGLMRRWKPIAGGRKILIVTRYDDVLEVFASDHAFAVPYRENLDIITDGQPFFLGMGDTALYRAQLAAMRAVCPPDDLPRLGDDAEARAAAIVDAAGGRVELVSLVRRVAFGLLGSYFGIPEPQGGSLAVWSSRLFEFQFTGSPDDKAWVAEVETFGRAARDHIDSAIVARKAQAERPDDVLSRCLARQAAGESGYSDVEIRTALLCMIVGGPPQPPMVLPQAMEQLLRRPEWLVAARAAARGGDDDRLRRIVMEAMRFDPLAPGLKRIAIADHVLARGMPHSRKVTKGTTLLAAFASAMMDSRRIPEPKRFDPNRQPHEYVHFGHGLHTCFGLQINHFTLHRMLRPLLLRDDLRRAPGAAGRLRKQGAFAERLELEFA